MRHTIGGTWLFQLMLLFILLFTAYIILTINYSKTIKIKNEVVSMIEKYEGLNDQSLELINNYLLAAGYGTTGICVTNENTSWIYGAIDLTSATLELAQPGERYYYCVKKYNGVNLTNYFQVGVFYKFNLPVIGNTANFNVKGTTTNFHAKNNSEYCYNVDGTCGNKFNGNNGNNVNNKLTYYKVTFASDGGTQIPSQNVEKGKQVSEPNISPTKDGCTFSGWQLNDSNYNFDTPVTEPITLVAKWVCEVDKYNIKFEFDGGKLYNNGSNSVGYDTLSYDCEAGEYFKFYEYWNKVEKDKFMLDYFRSSDGNKYYSSNASFVCSKNITLTAVWKSVGENSSSNIKYEVNFDLNGGTSVKMDGSSTNSVGISSQFISSGGLVTKPSDPYKYYPSSSFVGWYLEGNLYDFNTPVTSNITLTARWEPKIKIRLVSNCGVTNHNLDTNEITNSKSVGGHLHYFKKGDKIGNSSPLVFREGPSYGDNDYNNRYNWTYTFNNVAYWRTGSGTRFDLNTPLSKDMILYAVCKN